MSIEPGRIVRVHSLTSAAGMELNGQRAAVLRLLDNGRYECKVEFDLDTFNKTIAIEPEKLKVEERLPLPSGYSRGNTMVGNDDMTRTLCELLLWYRDGYEPPETMLSGYAAMALMRMGQQNFMFFTAGQMEQMAAVLALANICQQAEEPSTCDALFALLEGDTMYLEVVAQTLYWTGYIGHEEKCKNENAFMDCPPTRLTPDQDEDASIRTMSEGPLLLLREMSKYKLGVALFAALKKQCQFYHLVVQRLLRLTAREALKTKDGRALGKKARVILGDKILGIKVASISKKTAKSILENAGTVLTSPEATTDEAIKGLLEIS